MLKTLTPTSAEAEVTGARRKVMSMMLQGLAQFGTWPILSWVEAELRDLGQDLDVYATVRDLPEEWGIGGTKHAHVLTPSAYGLSLRGLVALARSGDRSAERVISEFLWAVDRMVDADAAVTRDPHKPVAATWTSDDARAARPRYPDVTLRRIYQVTSEDGQLDSGSIPPPTDLPVPWSFTVRLDVQRFAEVQTIDDYLRIRHGAGLSRDDGAEVRDPALRLRLAAGWDWYGRVVDHHGWSPLIKTAGIIGASTAVVVFLAGALTLVVRLISHLHH